MGKVQRDARVHAAQQQDDHGRLQDHLHVGMVSSYPWTTHRCSIRTSCPLLCSSRLRQGSLSIQTSPHRSWHRRPRGHGMVHGQVWSSCSRGNAPCRPSRSRTPVGRSGSSKVADSSFLDSESESLPSSSSSWTGLHRVCWDASDRTVRLARHACRRPCRRRAGLLPGRSERHPQEVPPAASTSSRTTPCRTRWGWSPTGRKASSFFLLKSSTATESDPLSEIQQVLFSPSVVQ